MAKAGGHNFDLIRQLLDGRNFRQISAYAVVVADEYMVRVTSRLTNPFMEKIREAGVRLIGSSTIKIRF